MACRPTSIARETSCSWNSFSRSRFFFCVLSLLFVFEFVFEFVWCLFLFACTAGFACALIASRLCASLFVVRTTLTFESIPFQGCNSPHHRQKQNINNTTFTVSAMASSAIARLCPSCSRTHLPRSRKLLWSL
jgi:hypothetical protein